MKTFKHNLVELPKMVQVNSDTGRYYITPQGNHYPSVTTVTGKMTKVYIDEWRKKVGDKKADEISSAAAKRGTALHKTLERYLLNEDLMLNENLMNKSLFLKVKPVVDYIDNLRVVEGTMYSDEMKLAGTTDCIADYRDELSVIDFKTSTRVKTKDSISNYFMQCAAYGKMFEEHYNITPKKIVIIMGVPNAPFPLRFVEPYAPWIDKLQTFLKENP